MINLKASSRCLKWFPVNFQPKVGQLLLKSFHFSFRTIKFETVYPSNSSTSKLHFVLYDAFGATYASKQYAAKEDQAKTG